MSDENTTDIPPALTPEEWKARRSRRGGADFGIYNDDRRREEREAMYVCEPSSLGECIPIQDDANAFAALIAIANAAMNDEDPRKFTRETVRRLRTVAADLRDSHGSPSEPVYDDREVMIDIAYLDHWLDDLADVIESYLPKEVE